MFWLLFLAALLVLPSYLFAPLQVWQSQRSPVTRTRPLRPGELPDASQALVVASLNRVAALGFEAVGVHEANGGAAVVVHAARPETGDQFLDYLMPVARWQVFLTRFADGQEVVTANTPLPSVFTPPPGLHGCRLPAGTDEGTLLRVHRAHVARRMGAGAVGVPVGDSTTFVEGVELRSLDAQREFGLYQREGDVYRPTLRGAFVHTWRLLPPLKTVAASRNDRLMRELLDARA